MFTNSIFFFLSLNMLRKLAQYRISFRGLHTLPFVPAKVWENADKEKLEILAETKGKSGIYMWKNLKSGKIYIGSARELKRRLSQYYNVNHLVRDTTMYIYKAILKHGYYSFSLYILEYCNEENLIQREQYYLDTLKPDYNICTTAGSTTGKLHTEAAKDKISAAKKGTYSGEANHFYAKSHSAEAVIRMSEAKLGKRLSDNLKNKISSAMLAREFSEEHKTNLSLAQPNRKRLSVLDLETGKETIYDSVASAERVMNLPKDSIRANLRSRNKNPYRNRYVFKIID